MLSCLVYSGFEIASTENSITSIDVFLALNEKQPLLLRKTSGFVFKAKGEYGKNFTNRFDSNGFRFDI